MDPAQRLQVPIMETLHANRQAGHASPSKVTETFLLECAGVGFHGDFAVRRQAQTGADVADQRGDGGRVKQTGRAATDEHAVHHPAPDQRQRGFQIGHQRLRVRRLRQIASRVRMRVEIAVRAFA